MSSPSVPQSLPMDLDDPAVQEALLLANLNGVISGFTSALVNAGLLTADYAYAHARQFAARIWADPAARDVILSGIRVALTHPTADLRLPPLDLGGVK